MPDLAAGSVLAIVLILLILGAGRQFVQLGARGQILDSLAILPQWKFFAFADVATCEEVWDDHHLLVRVLEPDGTATAWNAIFWNEERVCLESLWNPQMRPRGEIQNQLALAAARSATASDAQFQSSLTYLTLLRYCIDKVQPDAQQALQFSIVASRGRSRPPLSVKFVSAWHTR